MNAVVPFALPGRDHISDSFGLGDWLERSMPYFMTDDLVPPQIPLDLYEREDCYILMAAVPGYAPEELQIEGSASSLILRGEHREQAGDQLRLESRFERSIALPDDCKPDQAKATVANGLLHLEIPKDERNRRYAIEIRPEGTSRKPRIRGVGKLFRAPGRFLPGR